MKHEYKIDTGLWYNCYECQDYYEDEPEVSETDAISAAIQHCKTQAPRNCGVMYEQYTAVAEWLTELAGFKDETPITPMILKKIGFEEKKILKRIIYFTYKELTVTQDELSTKLVIEINTPELELNIAKIQTIGQLRMFLTLCGLGDFVKQLKE